MPVRGTAILLAMSAAMASSAHASPWINSAVGAPDSSAAHADAAALAWNPAFLEGLDIIIYGHGLWTRDRFARRRLGVYQDPTGSSFELPVRDASLVARSAENPAAVSSQLAFLPGFFFSWPLGQRSSAAFGVYSPWNAGYSYGGASDQRWSITTLDLTTVDAAAGFTTGIFDLPARIGAAISARLGRLAVARDVDFAGQGWFGDAIARPPARVNNAFGAGAPSAIRELDSMTRPFETHTLIGLGLGATLGVALTAIPDVAIGLSYSINGKLAHCGDFTLDLDHPFFTQRLADRDVTFAKRPQGTACIEVNFPNKLNLTVAWQAVPRLTLTWTFAWIQSSSIENLDIQLDSASLAVPALRLGPKVIIDVPRRWNDSFETRLTADLAVTAQWRIGPWMSYSSAAVPDSTIDAASVDGQQITAGAYVIWRPYSELELSAELLAKYMPERGVEHSDYDLANGRYGELALGARLGLHVIIR